MVTKDEVQKSYGLCNCDVVYTSRGMTAPDCPMHAFLIDEAMDTWAESAVEALKKIQKMFVPVLKKQLGQEDHQTPAGLNALIEQALKQYNQ